jgi:AraC-like DNA-binding protein
MAVNRLVITRFLPPGGCFHVARSECRQTSQYLHAHDFPEVFWIESGAGEHRINGGQSELTAGDLVLIRPEDEHGFVAGPRGLVMVNVAFPAAVVADLRQRYFAAGGCPWDAALPARSRRVGPAAMRRLREHAARLAAAYGRPGDRLALDRFLLDLVAELVPAAASVTPDPEMPGWLRSAISELAADRDALARGAGGLFRRTGRSREHVARTLRRTAGTSPHELVNGLRLDRAAEDLQMTAKPIVAVAYDAGYANLAYFYRRFRARFACTPKQYRRRHLEPVGG